MRGIPQVALMQSRPINKISTTRTAMSPFILDHSLELLETMQIIVTIDRRTFDIQRFRLLEWQHDDLNEALDQEVGDQHRFQTLKEIALQTRRAQSSTDRHR